VILGAVLIVAGFLLGASTLNLVPWPMRQVWDFVVKARGGIGIVLIGVLLIIWAQSGRTFAVPRRGTKLYRSRDDKWLGGVLGGLADYLGTDSTLLRLAFIALVVLFDVGGLVVAYIVMAIVVPQAPQVAEHAPAAQSWPTTAAPPASPPAAAQPAAPVPVPAAAPAPDPWPAPAQAPDPWPAPEPVPAELASPVDSGPVADDTATDA
jgi:phage shock protein PspC (stress-responsive transcriptional regulator)